MSMSMLIMSDYGVDDDDDELYHFDYHIIYAHHTYLRLSRSSTNSECDQISAPTIYPVSESEYCTVVTIIILCYLYSKTYPTREQSIYLSITSSIHPSIHVFIHISKNVYIQLFIHQTIHFLLHSSFSSSIFSSTWHLSRYVYLRFHLTLSAKL